MTFFDLTKSTGQFDVLVSLKLFGASIPSGVASCEVNRMVPDASETGFVANTMNVPIIIANADNIPIKRTFQVFIINTVLSAMGFLLKRLAKGIKEFFFSSSSIRVNA